MFSMTIQPRFVETDALGHINNTVVPVWFEAAREPIFKIFNPTLDLNNWNLIIAKIEVNFIAQMDYQPLTEIRTFIAKVGTSSMTIRQQVVQLERIVAEGECVMVKFDYVNNKAAAISDAEKAQLNQHQI